MSFPGTPERGDFLATHASNVAFMRDQVGADGHFRVDLVFSGPSGSVHNPASLEQQWHKVMRPICATATRIRLFGRPEGVRLRMAAADRWHQFLSNGSELLSKFTTSQPDGREEFEVLKDRLLSEDGTAFWLWCMLAVEKSALRPVILLPSSEPLRGTFFSETTDPVVVKGYEDAIPKAAIQFAKEHARTGGIAMICAHARDTHELSLLGSPGAITGLYELALTRARLTDTFVAVLGRATR